MVRSRCGADGPGHSVRRLSAWALGALVAVLGLLTTVSAQEYIPPGQPIPQGIRWVNATATGANTSAYAKWTNAFGQTSYHRFPVPVSSATLGSLARGAIRRGLPLAGWAVTFRSLLDGAGWAIDELQGQVMIPGREQPELNAEGWCHYRSSGWTCFNSLQDVRSYVDETYAEPQRAKYGGGPLQTVESGPTSYNLILTHANGAQSNWVVHWRTTSGAVNGYPASVEAQPVTDADLGNMIKSQPVVVNAVLIDPNTGAPIRTAELVDGLNKLARELAAREGVDPPPDLEPDDDFANEVPSETEWPGFCDWAYVVCEFIEWVKDTGPDPEKPEVPIDELQPSDFVQEWSSGLGGGSCPAPVTFSILDGDGEFSYEPICNFVDTLRPMFIAMALLMGAFIVAGVRSGKNA